MRARLDALLADDHYADVHAGRSVSVSIADLREDIVHGQSVARYTLHGRSNGTWRVLSRGITIGYRKLDRFEPVPVSAVRLTIEETVGETGPVRIALY
jgi:hypothetical protein